MDKYQAQIVILSAQISWSESVEKALQLTADGKARGTSALESNYMLSMLNCYIQTLSKNGQVNQQAIANRPVSSLLELVRTI